MGEHKESTIYKPLMGGLEIGGVPPPPLGPDKYKFFLEVFWIGSMKGKKMKKKILSYWTGTRERAIRTHCFGIQ